MAVTSTVRTQGHDGSSPQLHGLTLFLPKHFHPNVTSQIAMELIIFLCCYATNVSHHGLGLPSSDTIVLPDSESTSFRQSSHTKISRCSNIVISLLLKGLSFQLFKLAIPEPEGELGVGRPVLISVADNGIWASPRWRRLNQSQHQCLTGSEYHP